MLSNLLTGRTVEDAQFKEQALQLRQSLLRAQFQLPEHDYPVIILIAGLPGSGKGPVVHRLNEWMDPRGITTCAFWDHSDEESSRPFYWRFWRHMPAKGKIGIFLGSWYTAPLQAAFANADMADIQNSLHSIEAFERMLCDDGALILKIWLHVSEETQVMQVAENAPGKKQNPRIPTTPEDIQGTYKRQLEVAELAIQATDSSHSPWHLIEAEDHNYRDITVGKVLLKALQERSAKVTQPDHSQMVASSSTTDTTQQPNRLGKLDLGLALDKDDYKKKLRKYQARLQDLAWEAYRQKRPVVGLFEGWDAAGKGSAIRRVTQSIDPRLYSLIQFAAPSDEERAHHYLWRFWRKLERDGRVTLFDRSWYGRVLVERVEGFARDNEWQRAYSEIRDYEDQLLDHGSILLKFWIHIDPEEQLRRFEERKALPHKQHKITPDDWRNREKWPQYDTAIEEMIRRTSTHRAPWTLIEGNNKRFARIRILKAFCSVMEDAL